VGLTPGGGAGQEAGERGRRVATGSLVDHLGAGPIALDTVVFIYLIEEHPRYVPLVEPIFVGIDRGRWEAVTSAVTLLETLVVPYRSADVGLAARYEELLTRSRGLRLVDLDRPLLRAAAQLRAAVPLKTPDALQLAAALGARASVFVTNDRALPRLPGLRILQLRDYADQA
jgi:predicted nucleic acid-binding protein